MASSNNEGDEEAEYLNNAADPAAVQQQLAFHDPQQQQQQSSNYDYGAVAVAVAASAASNPNENKWNKNGFGQGDVTIRSGKYSKEETEAVKFAVEEYCAMKQITVSRLCSECDHKAELKGAWMEIAKCLSHRSVQSVYRHGLRQLHPFKRGAWTDDEVEILIGSVAQYGKKWAAIQTKLNRSADSCRDKYREMDDSYIRGRWKENETEQLKRLIREHLRADPRADIKELGKMVDTERIKIPWSIISKRMGKRSRLSCFKKWQKMTGLFSPSDQPAPIGATAGAGASTNNNNNVEHIQHQHQHSHHTNNNRVESMLINMEHQHQHHIAALPSDHAPTAGGAAAAAALAGVVKISIGGSISEEAAAVVDVDIDVYLLSELVSSCITKASDVNWEDLRIDNAQERWYELLEEWQSSIMDDSLLALPISEIAQLIVERKTSAQRAAETVEAVDLPNPLWNHDQ